MLHVMQMLAKGVYNSGAKPSKEAQLGRLEDVSVLADALLQEHSLN